MRHALVIANLKMMMTHRADVTAYCDRLRHALAGAHLPQHVRIVVCPSLPHLDVVARCAGVEPHIAVGAQDMAVERRGAYTGQVSPQTLADSGVTYVLTGHSEQRTHRHMTDDEIGATAAAALLSGLTPVVFVGETADERAAGQISDVVGAQVRAVTTHVRSADLGRCVFVYEPVWAIGADVTPTVEDIMSAQILIRKVLASVDPDLGTADGPSILYGGSVTPSNAAALCDGIAQGTVLGRASLDPHALLAVATAVAQCQEHH